MPFSCLCMSLCKFLISLFFHPIREHFSVEILACFQHKVLHANLWPCLRFMFVMKCSCERNDFRQSAADNAAWIMRNVACLVTNWRIRPLDRDNHFSKFYERDLIDLYAINMMCVAFFVVICLFLFVLCFSVVFRTLRCAAVLWALCTMT